jgi:hypothetical protein
MLESTSAYRRPGLAQAHDGGDQELIGPGHGHLTIASTSAD